MKAFFESAWRSAAVCLLALGPLVACGNERASSTDDQSPGGVQLALQPAAGHRLRGVASGSDNTARAQRGTWLSQGYGLALQITADEFTWYQVSEDSCFEVYRAAFEDRPDQQLAFRYNLDGQSIIIPYRTEIRHGMLIAHDSGTVSYTFERARRLPPACAHGGTQATDDPELNFELFWQHFAEHYAFFALQGVDWNAQYAAYRPRVTSVTTSDELFQLMAEMLAPFHDYHISLTSESNHYSLDPPAEIVAHLDDIYGYLLSHYVQAEGVTVTGNGLLAYQRLPDGVGYILSLGMLGFAGFDELALAEDPVATEMARAGAALDEALTALADAPALIVDVRFNPGGADAVSLTLASRFADRTRLAFQKRARAGDGFTPLRELYVVPAGARQFRGRVALLTSVRSVSAAETFIMAMRVLPHVTVIGEATAGSHSDILDRQLPNGWQVGLSNEEYIAADRHVYERVGIPPDITVALDAPGFAADRDAIVLAARAYLARP